MAINDVQLVISGNGERARVYNRGCSNIALLNVLRSFRGLPIITCEIIGRLTSAEKKQTFQNKREDVRESYRSPDLNHVRSGKN